jgi:hypothetical protein
MMITANEANLVPLKMLEPIMGWEEFLKDGEGYLRTAVGGYQKRQQVFTSEILYNIIAMAIEKFVMAALMRHGAMPYNHTMGDLVEAMESTFPGRMGTLGEGLLDLDRYQEICDVDAFNICPPGMEKISGMLELAKELHTLVVEELVC